MPSPLLIRTGTNSPRSPSEVAVRRSSNRKTRVFFDLAKFVAIAIAAEPTLASGDVPKVQSVDLLLALAPNEICRAFFGHSNCLQGGTPIIGSRRA